MKVTSIRLSGYDPDKGTYVHQGECGLSRETYELMKDRALDGIFNGRFSAAHIDFMVGLDCVRYYHVTKYGTTLHDFWIEPEFVSELKPVKPRLGHPDFSRLCRAVDNEAEAMRRLEDVRCIEV